MKIRKFNRLLELKQWRGNTLKSVISVDCETELIKYTGHIPRLVVTTAYCGDGIAYIIRNQNVREFLYLHHEHTLIFHNAPFDLNVLTKATGFEFWDMVESGKILDTMLLFQLVAIATRGYTHKNSSLDFVVSNLLKNTLPKDNNIRLTFGQYIMPDGSINYSKMSKEHYIYACLDPVATLLCYEELKKTIDTLPTDTNLAHTIHLMGHIALTAITNRGIGVDLEYANKLRDELQHDMDIEANILASYGWIRGKEGVQESYNQIINFLEIDLPTTQKGYSMTAEHLAPYSNLPFVHSLLKYLELEHRKGFLNEMTTDRVHPRYDPIKNTGRTSAFKPNIQNPPVKGGIREALVPKDGHVFIGVDYSAIEMFTAAMHMKNAGYGDTMFNVLNEGRDPHVFAAKSIFNKKEEDISKKERGNAKPANYGFLANMSPKTFVPYAAGYGLDLSLKESEDIKTGWTKAYPEVKPFWKSFYKSGGLYKSKTGFIRANCGYSAWLNNHFQGPAAEGIKISMYFAHKAGLKLVAMIHDELVCEELKVDSEANLELLEGIMVDGMKKICPMNICVDGEIKENHGK